MSTFQKQFYKMALNLFSKMLPRSGGLFLRHSLSPPCPVGVSTMSLSTSTASMATKNFYPPPQGGAGSSFSRSISGDVKINETQTVVDAVSYTHLTLPTNREV